MFNRIRPEKMPVQVRTINLRLIKWSQTRVSSFTTRRDTRNFDRGHCTALSLRTSDHIGQLAPVTPPFVELVNCSNPFLTEALPPPKDALKHLFDPCWGQVSTCSLSDPTLPLASVLSPQSLVSSQSCSSLHISDFNSSLAKLVDPVQHSVFMAKDIDSIVAFSPLRDETANSLNLSEDRKPETSTVMKVPIPSGATRSQSVKSTPTWNHSESKRHLMIFRCNGPTSSQLTCSSSSKSKGSTPTPPGDRPSEEQLFKMKEKLIQVVPLFFRKPHDYRMYNQNLEFHNNFWGKESVTRGLPAYMMEISKARILSHIKFTHLQMNIIKITMHPEDGSIRVHWRVTGLSQLKTLQFWKFLPWTYRNSLKKESQSFDGISTLFIGCDELIYKHRLDRLMPEEEPMLEKSPNLALKLGLMFGLLPQHGVLALPFTDPIPPSL